MTKRDDTIRYTDRGPDRPKWPCCYLNGGRRFPTEHLRPPVPDAAEQRPRPGDDVLVSATTKRFSLYANGHRIDSDVDWKPVAAILAEFGNTNPTVGDIRKGIAVRMCTQAQLELRQRPKDAPEKEKITGPNVPSGKAAAAGL